MFKRILNLFACFAIISGLSAFPTDLATAKECHWRPTSNLEHTIPLPTPPERSSVGKGHFMMGVVRAFDKCEPLVHAKVIYWLAGPDGEYDDAHQGMVYT